MCVAGARVVQKDVTEQIESDDLVLFVVWIPMFPGDSHAKAVQSQKLISDPRAQHFWDADRTVGKLFRESLGLPQDQVPAAWDVYLVFDKQTKWTDSTPTQRFGMQQLSREEEHFLDGDILQAKVRELLP